MKKFALPILLALTLVAAGCAAHKSKVLSGPPVTAASPTLTYVAVGASESVGAGSDSPLQDAWPKLVWASMPRNTLFVDAAVPGYTTAQALSQELPRALALNPSVVTVWLNANDIVAGVSAGTYKAELLTLLTALRRNGQTQVYVANTPPLDQLPSYLAALAGNKQGTPFANTNVPQPAALNALVGSYNKSIGDVASQTGAKLVDLNALWAAAQANGTEASLVGTDGFHPSTAGHAAVAKAFIAAIGAGK